MSDRTITLRSSDRMSNTQYHKCGKPCWWARVGTGDNARFLKIPRVRGDVALDVEIDCDEESLPEGTVINFGVGNRDRGVRESYTVDV